MKSIFVNPQWQGGADPVTLQGAIEIEGLYLCGRGYEVMPVSDDAEAPLPVKGGLKASELLSILRTLPGNVVGLGIYEYAPAGKVVPLMGEILEIGSGL